MAVFGLHRILYLRLLTWTKLDFTGKTAQPDDMTVLVMKLSSFNRER